MAGTKRTFFRPYLKDKQSQLFKDLGDGRGQITIYLSYI